MIVTYAFLTFQILRFNINSLIKFFIISFSDRILCLVFFTVIDTTIILISFLFTMLILTRYDVVL